MLKTRNIFFLIIAVAIGISGIAFFLGRDPDQNSQSPQSNFDDTSRDNILATEMASDIAKKDALVISIASSSTKRSWLDEATRLFNEETVSVQSGQRIIVEVTHVTSGGSMNAILDGAIQPIAWSPGDSSWVAQANEAWEQRTNQPIASQACSPTVYAPLGFAMWRPMAETLGWPEQPISWSTIVELANDPEGWASYGRPEWGAFTFGHTHPAYANSGLMSMTGFVYGVAGKGVDLKAEDIYSPEVESAMRTLELNTAKYGRSAPALLELMAKEGTGFLHAAAVPEADTVRFNVERADELTLPLAFIFPSDGTIWANHPYCVLDNAEWVSEEEAEAAHLFFDYLRSSEQQLLASENYLRPIGSNPSSGSPLSLENGTDPTVTIESIPNLPSPSADISAAIIEMFAITKRKATVLLAIDVSGSMGGERIATARDATSAFLKRLDPDDTVGLMVFESNVHVLVEPQRVGDVSESLDSRIQGLSADGNTNLYGAICDAVAVMEAEKAADIAEGDSRLYGIILLSDGEDTEGAVRENQMFTTCLPDSLEADGVKVFPIAFGDGADEQVLSRIAESTAGRMFTADPSSIDNIYLSISAEQ